jgi:hypothetical protein
MRTIKKRSLEGLSEAFRKTGEALLRLDNIDEDCEGFDEFDKAYLALEKASFHLYHTIYVAERQQEVES